MVGFLTMFIFYLNILVPRKPSQPVSSFDVSEFGLIGPVLTLYTKERSINLFTAISEANGYFVPLGALILTLLFCFLIAILIIKRLKSKATS
ncbi:hypothetical protein ACA30_14030 [Virgibacillus soli]|uniref:Uncharacterized protein n=2 Tax=Lederbergia galactosidilytica TaxID=217031 RepID=A0A0Q9XZ85_9BACI|nr:hypothetical protein ACA30_14030 [Virgibacillus soli]KRG14022.1 hypothetical protein ACA29_06540 [Lederbergia galactosidilytica]OAK67424.1 hypothetical protein ABB05_19970 [Lederbergia galactosidilytica]